MEQEIKRSLELLDANLAREWGYVSAEIERCIAAGDYDSERVLRQRAFERQRELIRMWQDWRVGLPPFTTKEKGYYRRHPITPENRHLLSPVFS